jgi:predicted O-methyltransferase YrrM
MFDAWPAGITADSGATLASMVAGEKATRCIETGFALGFSTSFILEGMLNANPEAEIRHVVVDPFQRASWDNAGLMLMKRLGLSELALLLEEDSLIALPRLISEHQRFDFGFVDGSHYFEHAFCDTLYMTRLVRPTGLIVLDDYWMPAVKAAVNFFTRNLGLVHENKNDQTPSRRFAVLRQPERDIQRKWDHFEPFGIDAAVGS